MFFTSSSRALTPPLLISHWWSIRSSRHWLAPPACVLLYCFEVRLPMFYLVWDFFFISFTGFRDVLVCHVPDYLFLASLFICSIFMETCIYFIWRVVFSSFFIGLLFFIRDSFDLHVWLHFIRFWVGLFGVLCFSMVYFDLNKSSMGRGDVDQHPSLIYLIWMFYFFVLIRCILYSSGPWWCVLYYYEEFYVYCQLQRYFRVGVLSHHLGSYYKSGLRYNPISDWSITRLEQYKRLL